MQSEMRSRIAFYNFIMTLVVVIYHTGIIGSPVYTSRSDQVLTQATIDMIQCLLGLAMTFFFTVTALLFFYHLSWSTLPGKLIKRVFSVLVPYLVWQMLTTLLYKIQGANWTLTECLRRIFFFDHFPPDGALWYLYIVFFMFLLSPILLFLFRAKKTSWYLTLVMIAAWYLIQSTHDLHIYQVPILSLIFAYLPPYLLGAFIGRFYDELATTDLLKGMLPVLFVSFIISASGNGLFSFVVPKVLVLCILFLFPAPSGFHNSRLSKISFLIYATHQVLFIQLIDRIQPVLVQTIPFAFVQTLTSRALFLVLDLICVVLMHVVLKRISPKALWLLSGGRA